MTSARRGLRKGNGVLRHGGRCFPPDGTRPFDAHVRMPTGGWWGVAQRPTFSPFDGLVETGGRAFAKKGKGGAGLHRRY